MRISLFIFAIISSIFLSITSVAKPVPVEHYSRLPAIYDATISPDGNWLATVLDYEGKYILRVFNLGDRSDANIRATQYPSTVTVNWIKWANNEQLLISTSKSEKAGGVVYYQGFLYVADRDLKDAKIVLRPYLGGGQTGSRSGGSGGIRQYNNTVVDFLPDDPEYIIMSFGKEDQFKPGVHKVNINNRSQRQLKRGSSHIQYWLTDRRSEVRLGKGRKDKDGEWRITIRDAESNKWRGHKDYPGLKGNTSVFGFTSNPNELIIGAYNGKDTLGLYVYDLGLKKRTRKLFHHGKYDVNDIILSPNGKKVVGASYLADTLKREFFEPASKARLTEILDELPGHQVQIIEQTLDGNKAIFKGETATSAPWLYYYNFSTHTGSSLSGYYPEIGDTKQGNVTKVGYTARDGFKVSGYVTTPPKIGTNGIALKNQPFIIMPHGGPYSRDTASFDYLAQFMASRGYSVLQMNFRGSEGYGDAHEQAGRKNWELMQEDVEDGTYWLIKKSYADKDRVCIVGRSYGGYAALMGAIKDPELYACAASIAGVTDLKDMIRDLKKYRFGRHTAKHFILKGFEDKDDIRDNSPVKRAEEITTPIFLAHGTQDVNVHFDQFTRMKGALKKSKAKATFMKFKNEDHYFLNYANRTKMMKGLDKFLAENLGDSAAAP